MYVPRSTHHTISRRFRLVVCAPSIAQPCIASLHDLEHKAILGLLRLGFIKMYAARARAWKGSATQMKWAYLIDTYCYLEYMHYSHFGVRLYSCASVYAISDPVSRFPPSSFGFVSRAPTTTMATTIATIYNRVNRQNKQTRFWPLPLTHRRTITRLCSDQVFCSPFPGGGPGTSHAWATLNQAKIGNAMPCPALPRPAPAQQRFSQAGSGGGGSDGLLGQAGK